jgi:hypothetical protein
MSGPFGSWLGLGEGDGLGVLEPLHLPYDGWHPVPQWAADVPQKLYCEQHCGLGQQAFAVLPHAPPDSAVWHARLVSAAAPAALVAALIVSMGSCVAAHSTATAAGPHQQQQHQQQHQQQ